MVAGRRVGEQRVCSLLVPCSTQKSAQRAISQFFNSLLILDKVNVTCHHVLCFQSPPPNK